MLLELEGFGALGRGVYVHPRDRTQRLAGVIARMGLQDGVMIFRAELVQAQGDRALVSGLWDLNDLDERYATFLSHFSAARRRRSCWKKPEDAFRMRLALAIAFLSIAWGDPDLPDPFLPSEWKGGRAQRLAARFYQELVPGTLEHIERML